MLALNKDCHRLNALRLHTTQLPDILPSDGERYKLHVLYLDYESIIPHFAIEHVEVKPPAIFLIGTHKNSFHQLRSPLLH